MSWNVVVGERFRDSSSREVEWHGGGRGGGVIETRNGALRDLHASKNGKMEGWARHSFPQRSAYVGTPEFAF